MRWIIFLLLFFTVTADLYVRIDPFKVGERVSQFLEMHDINNCFERGLQFYYLN